MELSGGTYALTNENGFRERFHPILKLYFLKQPVSCVWDVLFAQCGVLQLKIVRGQPGENIGSSLFYNQTSPYKADTFPFKSINDRSSSAECLSKSAARRSDDVD